MKIVSWNCNGALRKKLSLLEGLSADLYIIQECEDPSRSTSIYKEWAGNFLWTGTTKNKGIGVFPKNDNLVKKLDWNGSFSIEGLSSNSPALKWRTEDLQLFLPFRLNDQLNILSVWTKGSENQIFSYIGQFWKYLQIHKTDLKDQSQAIIGDFNSNKLWDKDDKWWNHTDVVAELDEMGIRSLYHYQYNKAQGEESHPTLFLQRNKSKPYHIDYSFLSNDLLPKSKIAVGGYDDWISLSDHMPLIITLDL